MTKNEVIFIKHYRPLVNTSAYGSEQWVYRTGGYAEYVYFESGCVVNWQR